MEEDSWSLSEGLLIDLLSIIRFTSLGYIIGFGDTIYCVVIIRGEPYYSFHGSSFIGFVYIYIYIYIGIMVLHIYIVSAVIYITGD
jgi:hypothetical protein